jgi:hypothetical protein
MAFHGEQVGSADKVKADANNLSTATSDGALKE